MRTSLWFVGAAVASAVVGVAVFRSDPMNRATIDALRVDPAALDASLKEIFAKTHISFGVEVVDSVAAQPRISPAVRTAAILDLSGLSARQAFSRLLVAAPAYDSSRADGMIIVRPRNRRTDADAWLDRRHETFEVTNVPLRDALHAVHRLFDPG